MSIEQLQNNILTLFHLQSQIHAITQSLNTIQQNEDYLNKIKNEGYLAERVTFSDILNATLSNHTIILYCSFLEEYHQHFTPRKVGGEYEERIIKVKLKNKPGIKRINQWNNIFDFRNFMAAHNFRTKNKSSFFSEEFELHEFVIPNKNSEKNLMDGIIYLICWNIRSEFSEIVSTLNPDFKMLDKLNIIGFEIDNEKELEELSEQML